MLKKVIYFLFPLLVGCSNLQFGPSCGKLKRIYKERHGENRYIMYKCTINSDQKRLEDSSDCDGQ